MDVPAEGQKEVLNRDFESTLESVDVAEAAIFSAGEQEGFDEDDLHKIGMAVRECMVNAVVHGNRYNVNKHVHVVVTLDSNPVVVDVGVPTLLIKISAYATLPAVSVAETSA